MKHLEKRGKNEKKRLFASIIVPFLFLFLAFTLKLIETLEGVSFSELGIKPLSLQGLPGILLAPVIHGDWEHLGANAIPLMVLGTSLFYFYRGVSFRVFLLIYLLTGAWVWFGARDAWHIGASGVIYGLGAFLFFSGIIRNHIPLIALSLIVVFLYGSLIWGIIPFKWDVPYSWESHLWGSIAGLVLAIVYRKEGPQRTVYYWPEEEETEDDYWNTDVIESNGGKAED
ncbi:rhomboid family intramembrane serine protease [Marinilabiliaceae bacterium JC017]|nr:rhomboid family intramembrane serine protease [Marinilabiliaceae bacterium JC017]